MDADPDVMRHVGGLPADPVRHAEALARRIAGTYPPGLGYWSLLAKAEPGRFLGWVCLVPRDDGVPGVEIGWRLDRSAWGRGYASEAAAAVLRHALGLPGVDRVVATIHPGNERSMRVARGIGMTFAGDGTYFGEPCKIFAARREPAGPSA